MNNYTPLHWAAINGFPGSKFCSEANVLILSGIKKLIALGANPMSISSSGTTPLHLAARGGMEGNPK